MTPLTFFIAFLCDNFFENCDTLVKFFFINLIFFNFQSHFLLPNPFFRDVARLITSLLKERRRPKGGEATGLIY